MGVLVKNFFERATEKVARDLLGKRLVSTVNRKKVTGWIVETEAYLAIDDAACHAVRGKTTSNAAMFGPAGLSYVYPIHSRFCLNAVTGKTNEPSAVLIRAVQPESGMPTMITRRNQDSLMQLTSGPGKLCQAFAIDRKQDQLPLHSKRTIWIEDHDTIKIKPSQIFTTNRIGVTAAKAKRLRFVVADNEFVSGPKWMKCPVSYDQQNSNFS